LKILKNISQSHPRESTPIANEASSPQNSPTVSPIKHPDTRQQMLNNLLCYFEDSWKSEDNDLLTPDCSSSGSTSSSLFSSAQLTASSTEFAEFLKIPERKKPHIASPDSIISISSTESVELMETVEVNNREEGDVGVELVVENLVNAAEKKFEEEEAEEAAQQLLAYLENEEAEEAAKEAMEYLLGGVEEAEAATAHLLAHLEELPEWEEEAVKHRSFHENQIGTMWFDMYWDTFGGEEI